MVGFGKRNVFRLHFSQSREDFCRRGRGRSFLVDGPKTDKALELTNSGESGGRNLEAESIRSNAESRLECVKLKTITEIRRSRTRDAAYTAECYLVLDSLSGWEPAERLKQRSDVVSLNVFISMSRTAQFCIRRRQMDRCSEQHSSAYDEGKWTDAANSTVLHTTKANGQMQRTAQFCIRRRQMDRCSEQHSSAYDEGKWTDAAGRPDS